MDCLGKRSAQVLERDSFIPHGRFGWAFSQTSRKVSGDARARNTGSPFAGSHKCLKPNFFLPADRRNKLERRQALAGVNRRRSEGRVSPANKTVEGDNVFSPFFWKKKGA